MKRLSILKKVRSQNNIFDFPPLLLFIMSSVYRKILLCQFIYRYISIHVDLVIKEKVTLYQISVSFRIGFGEM